jgi:hypothetical protein
LAQHKDSTGKAVLSVDDIYKATKSAYEDVLKKDVAQGGSEPKFSTDTKTIMSHTDAWFPLSASPKEFASSVAKVENELNKALNLPNGYAIELKPQPIKAHQRPSVTASLVVGQPHRHRIVLDQTSFDVRD